MSSASAAERPTVDWELHDGQWAVYESPARFRVVVAGRRWGKTHLGRTILLDAALRTRKALLWYVAPTRVMAKDIIWADLKDAVRPWLVGAPLETEALRAPVQRLTHPRPRGGRPGQLARPRD